MVGWMDGQPDTAEILREMFRTPPCPLTPCGLYDVIGFLSTVSCHCPGLLGWLCVKGGGGELQSSIDVKLVT